MFDQKLGFKEFQTMVQSTKTLDYVNKLNFGVISNNSRSIPHLKLLCSIPEIIHLFIFSLFFTTNTEIKVDSIGNRLFAFLRMGSLFTLAMYHSTGAMLKEAQHNTAHNRAYPLGGHSVLKRTEKRGSQKADPCGQDRGRSVLKRAKK